MIRHYDTRPTRYRSSDRFRWYYFDCTHTKPIINYGDQWFISLSGMTGRIHRKWIGIRVRIRSWTKVAIIATAIYRNCIKISPKIGDTHIKE